MLIPGEIVALATGAVSELDLYASTDEAGSLGLDLAGKLARGDVALVTGVQRCGTGLFGIYVVRLVGPRGAGWIWGDLLRRVNGT